ncbi:MAG: choice-of-anchor D domain-containing protein [Verrucomicrobiota bacterium]
MFRVLLIIVLLSLLSQKSTAQFTDEANWFPLGGDPGFDDIVRCMVVDNTNDLLYAGGRFTSVESIVADRVAVWDGLFWSPLGLGMNNDVQCLAVDGFNVYAGGDFTQADGLSAFAIAQWDGIEWTAMGSGMNGPVYAIAVVDGDVYAGGNFTTAGGVTVNNIARWDGENWNALGNGTNGIVYALLADGSGVYVGGNFTFSSGTATNRVARWSGSEWEALGSGVSNQVFALASIESNLYVGGEFTFAGGSSIGKGVALWDGSSWSALGGGVGNSVFSLAVNENDEVFAGGIFPGRVGRWDGSSWSNLGSGTNNTVRTVATRRFDLFVGGDFTEAGGKETDYAARAITAVEPNLVVEMPEGTRLRSGESVDFGATAIDSTNATRVFTVRNLGNLTLEVTNAALTGDDDLDFFTIDTGNVLDPLAPDESATFSVTFLPTDTEERTVELELLSNDPDDSPFTLTLTGSDATPEELFDAAMVDAGLRGDDADPDAIPFDDGIENVLKYAFNLDLTGSDASTLEADGDSGLPRYSVVEDGGNFFFRFEFLRRKGSGLIYTPQKSTTLVDADFVALTAPETVEDVDPLWERVIIDEPIDLDTEPTGFGRLMVDLPLDEEA